MRKTQIDRAIDALKEQREALLAKASMEAKVIESAIVTLQAQKVKRASRPRAVAPLKDVG